MTLGSWNPFESAWRALPIGRAMTALRAEYNTYGLHDLLSCLKVLQYARDLCLMPEVLLWDPGGSMVRVRKARSNRPHCLQ